MTYTLNLRSQIYESLEALKEPLTRALSYLKSFRHDYYAERASKLIKRAFSVVKRILNHRCDDRSTILYLEDISRLLNIVVIRTRELYPQIANVAYDLYQQFIALFPGELSLQLELFDCGEFSPPIISSGLIFPGVKRFLDYWLTPLPKQQVTRWLLAQRKSYPFSRIEGEQLCLDFSGTSQEETALCVEKALQVHHLDESIATGSDTSSNYEEFLITVNGSAIKVRYNATWSRTFDSAHMEFHSVESPAQPIPISETGYRSHFSYRKNISSFHSPEHYALSFCHAMIRNKGKEPTFEQILEAKSCATSPTSLSVQGEDVVKKFLPLLALA